MNVIGTDKGQIAWLQMVGGIINKIIYISAFKQHDLIGVGMYMKRTFQLFPGTSVGEKILINIFGRYLIDHGSPASFLL